MKVRIFPTADELARATATLLSVRAARAIVERGQANLALSGGSTPRPIYEALASDPLKDVTPWQSCHFFWGDERCAPFENPASNFGQAKGLLLDHVPVRPAHLHPIPVDRYEPEEAAARYAAELRTCFNWRQPIMDFVLLGLGTDGHTASLFPHTPELKEDREWVLAVEPPAGIEPALPRVTLTLPVINSAHTVVIVASGAAKAEVVRQALNSQGGCNGSLPAALVRPWGELFWFLDQEAASLLAA